MKADKRIPARAGIPSWMLVGLVIVGGNVPVARADWQNPTHTPIPVWSNPPAYQPPVQLTPEQIQQQKAAAERNQRLQTAYIQNQQGIDAEHKGDWTAAIADFQNALQNSPDDASIRANLATAENNQGILAWTKGDMAAAVASLQNGARDNPKDAMIRSSLATALQILTAQQEEAERQRQDKMAAGAIQQTFRNFADNLKNTPVTPGGLDFDNHSDAPPPDGGDGLGFNLKTSTTTAGPAPGLDFADPSAVDARNVSSGLPKALDAEVARAFTDAPPDVRNRVTKGLEAVMNKDWSAAKAWFKDALNHDPDNALLKQWIAICDEPQGGAKPTQDKDAKSDAKPATKVIFPDDEEMEKLYDEALKQPDETQSTQK